MASNSDITSLFTRNSPDVGYHQGVIQTWNVQTGENTVSVVGSILSNLPMLNITEALVLRPGHVVGLLRFKTNYFILGRIVIPDTPDFFSGVMPNIAFPLWPTSTAAFLQNDTADSQYYPKWAGGFIVNHPKISFQAWLNLSGGAPQGNWRIAWYPSYPFNDPNPPNATVMYTSTVSANPTISSSTYTWPVGLFGTQVFLSFEVRLTVGAAGEWVGVIPMYLYGHSD